MNTANDIFVRVETISEELGISKPKAYKIIQELNRQLKEKHPNAIIIAGRVNRNWYYDALLRQDSQDNN